MPRKHLLILTAIAAPLLFWSCDNTDDDELLVPQHGETTADVTDPTNTNANPTNSDPVAARLEIPKLKGGVANMFLVKRISNGDINYCIEWDMAKKSQRWSAFRWDKSNSGGYVDRKGAEFTDDTDIPLAYRTTSSSYTGSGYTRGHICASADRWYNFEANRQTFLYSNMQPQLYDFNGGIWANLEIKVRSWNYNNLRDTLYVCKGGTIDDADNIIETTRSGLLVPKYFFMAILCYKTGIANGGYRGIAFILEHRDNYTNETNLKPYAMTIDQLEARTGIDFFCNLPDAIEDVVEANIDLSQWGLAN